MPIRIACPCGKQFRVKNEHAGKRARCPACGEALRVPVPDGAKVPPASVRRSPGAILDALPAHGPGWPGGVRAVSGLTAFGEYEIGLIATPSEILVVMGRQTSAHPTVIVCSTLVACLFCLPAGLVMLIAIPFDLTIFRKRRERAWQDFLRRDLEAVRGHRGYCKSFPLEHLLSISFSEANQKLYMRVQSGIRRISIKIKCAPADRSRFREFAEHCRSVSGASDRLFLSIP